jgi:hypothetical protein
VDSRKCASGNFRGKNIALQLADTFPGHRFSARFVRFCLPVSREALPLVEKVFDQVLDGHSLQSKGVSYVVAGKEQITDLLRSPLLVVTTEAAATEHPEVDKVPQALMCPAGEKAQMVRLRNVERLYDEELKGKLVGCAQLINIQSGGFLTEGHFSLSW